MDILRTPDDRFHDLPGYTFTPRYLEVSGLRVHYLDEGPRDAAPVLLLHGEPSWSFLYRKMVPPLVAAGHRVIAPDLVGFGRSDKPSRREDYTYQRHVDWMAGVLTGLDLSRITLFCQDWGGLIGLRLAAEHEARFARVVASNTFLPTGDERVGEAFFAWQRFSQEVPVFPAGRIVATGCAKPIGDDVIRAYDAPFPDESYKAGARQFPMLVPTRSDDPASAANRAAWEVLRRWEKPFLTAFGDSDPITRGADRKLQELIPGTRGQAHVTVKGGGHFVQEDCGEELAEIVLKFIAAS
jgi:haloalkane dehalogenase